ncbi:MAG: hypothetical protein ACYTFG_21680 [Planctomycetota bacterium]|jgi:hypothetical protein
MDKPSGSKLPRLFLAVMILCAQYMVLTTVAMFVFAGEGGYSFFDDYFSELGQTKLDSGEANWIACALFNSALGQAGIGLAMFFAAFPACFRQYRAKLLALIALPLGFASGVFFVGVALTPMDLFLSTHEAFFIWAFRAFPLAVLLATAAICLDRDYPNGYAAVFGVFAAMLVAYLLLISFGPDHHDPKGKMIQATGQKLIGYAAIGSILVQAWAARRIAQKRGQS